MNQDELALYTSQELIDELMRRKTFLGIVVHSEQEAKTDEWPEERIFRVRYNRNLEQEQVGRLLGVVSEYVDRLNA
ncbi:hypothetical protein [Singulisphaera sp. PoT]|uniref:hypothetical protein n=1 Tax=Singulisphaera sp. PoT TaxID=3411797 RepID=UPI003BF481E7